MLPVLMPTPNHLRYRKGTFPLRILGGVSIDSRALSCHPQLLDDVRRILGMDLAIAEESAFRILYAQDISFDLPDTFDPTAPESYTLCCTPMQLTLTAQDARGFAYALQTLKQLLLRADDDCVYVQAAEIADAPFLPVRGVHLYLPALEDFEDFKGFIDALAALKYNRIYFETAGMEIKKHPEMNEAWEKFAQDLFESPEKPKLYQSTFKYQKDSLHIECCGGKTISQQEVRGLVEYCRARQLEVVPEVQSLTHCHFLTLAHREIAERPEDPYSDTYCPMNDRSYELLFDVMDEVIDVFTPKIVNIGHDEYYSIGVCDRCRSMDPADLLAMDVTRIHDHLAAKGIQTEMWADKFVNAHNTSGRGEGGAFKMIDSYEVSKIFEVRGATYPALEKIPKDVLLGNWFWGIYPHGFDRFDRHGFTSTFNNFVGAGVSDFDHYARIPSVRGGTCSHWSWVHQENMARDGFFFNVVYSAYPLWNASYTNDSYEAVRDLTIAYLPYFYQNYNHCTLPSRSLRGTEKASVITRHEQHESYYLDTSFVEVRNFRHTHVKHEVGTFHSKIDVYNVPQTFRVGVVRGAADSLVFTHGTDVRLPHKPTDHGYRMENNLMGHYTVVYADDTRQEAPIYFGKEIGPLDADWGRARESAMAFSTDIYLQQAAYYAQPCLVPESKAGLVTMYRYEWINPSPEKEIREIIFTANRLDTPYSVFIADIRCLREVRA